MGTNVITEVPLLNTSRLVARNEFPLVWMDDNVVDWMPWTIRDDHCASKMISKPGAPLSYVLWRVEVLEQNQG